MKVYYVKWRVKSASNLDNSLHHLSSIGSSYGQQTVTAVKGRYFVSKDKAETLAKSLNEAATLLQQYESQATIEELEVEE